MKGRVICCCLCCLLLVPFLSWGYAPNKEAVKFKKGTQQNQILTDFIKGAEEVAIESGIGETLENVIFFKRSYFQVIPKTHKDRFILEAKEDAPDEDYIIGVIIPVVGDAEKWRETIENDPEAFSWAQETPENMSLIILEEFPVSKKWGGVLLIHKIIHARLHAAKVFEIDDLDFKSAAYELYAYTVQNEMLQSIGKEKYQNIIAKEVKRIKAELEEKKTTAPRHDYIQELDDIFGQPRSKEEIESRMEYIWVESFLSFCDQKYEGDKAIINKLVFLKKMLE